MENIKLRRRKDLTGKVFGRLTVLSDGERRTPSGGMYWLCKCECGTIKEVPALALSKGITVSCGCYNKEVNSNRAIHGHNRKKGKKSPTYISWTKMNDRCNNQKCPEFKWYGERGIIICESWKSFSNFLADMGERPEGKTLDRKDPNGNYEPSNCRWITQKEQANNTRRNVFITHNQQTKTVSEWADYLGIKYGTLYGRLFKYNIPLEKAIVPNLYSPSPNSKNNLKIKVTIQTATEK